MGAEWVKGKFLKNKLTISMAYWLGDEDSNLVFDIEIIKEYATKAWV